METKLTPAFQNILKRAGEAAVAAQRNGVDTNQLFCSFLLHATESIQMIFDKAGISLEDTLVDKEEKLQKRKCKNASSKLNKSIRSYIDSLLLIDGIDFVPPENLFYFFLSNDCFKEEDFLKIKSATDLFFNDQDDIFSLVGELYGIGEELDEDGESPMFEENVVLSQFATNLNLKSVEQGFDKYIDYDNKIAEITTVLCRKKKPNAILVGPEGTGKTSIIQELARQIVTGRAPELLRNKVIYSVDLAGMVAGTEYRGQFEERLKKFVEEVKGFPNIILFIDEIHTLVGAGGTNAHSLEASNILKPALGSGEISCIGATTTNEYTHTIKKDPALDRRFERITIREPNKFRMAAILPQILSYYEGFHVVKYSEDFISNVVEYCEKFLPNKHYPDKAIDVIDSCGAQTKIGFWETSQKIKAIEEDLMGAVLEGKECDEDGLERLNNEVDAWRKEKEGQIPDVGLESLVSYFQKRRNKSCEIIQSDAPKEFLEDIVVGQEEAISSLLENLLVSDLNLFKKRSPDSFIVIGEDNTGKTLFFDTLQDVLQKGGASVIGFNGIELSSFSDREKIVSQVVGANTLCNKVLMTPNNTIFIDDLHKIGNECKGLLVQILKEGRLESRGEIVDFSNCKFFFTCLASVSGELGFGEAKDWGIKSLLGEDLEKFITYKILFKKLDAVGLKIVLGKRLAELKKSLLIRGVELVWGENFVDNFVNGAKNVKELNAKIKKDLLGQVVLDLSRKVQTISLV